MHRARIPDAIRERIVDRRGRLALFDRLDVAEGDLTVEKTRFSAFIQGASNLDKILKQRGVDTVIIAGTLTNRCCESTARDAMMIGYKVVFVEDANAAAS